MQNNTSDRHEIHAYPVTLCKARKNQRDYYMGQKTFARSYSALQFSEQPRRE